jgi:UDP-N-acetylmuramate--alanine ligase
MFEKYKKIHFVGIGGIGVSALAKWAMLDGVEVSGSDAAPSIIIDEAAAMGAKIFIGHKKENVPKGAELIIYSDAVPADNPERKNKIPQKSYFEALGEITREKKTIAVSGTNGKSTTTAMLGKILIDAGLDPTIIVGSRMKDFKYGNFHPGQGEYFVLEACEHNAHMLHLSPEHIVLTNIEADHLDFYKNLENILSAFQKYVAKKPASGLLVYNADDKNIASILPKDVVAAASFGLPGAKYAFKNRRVKDGRQLFDVLQKGEKIGVCELQIPGMFNVYNAMAALSMALELGVTFEMAAKSLGNFSGIWRRFELIGEYKKSPVVSDYGHHPQAITMTLLAAREFYPERRIVLAFQPHQHHRTKSLFADFVRAFDAADVVILAEIYNVTGRVAAEDADISSEQLMAAIKKYWATDEDAEERKIHQIFYTKDMADTEAQLRKIVKKGDIAIIMGAGDIYKAGEGLVESSK